MTEQQLAAMSDEELDALLQASLDRLESLLDKAIARTNELPELGVQDDL